MDNEQVDASLRGFAKAFGAKWFALMSGGASVPFAIAALVLEGWQSILTGVLACICAFTGAYLVWRPERQKVVELTERLRRKIRCNFDPQSAACIAPTTFTNGVPVRYFRLRVECDAVGYVSSCMGRLLAIKHNGTTIFDSEPMRLTFAPATSVDTLAKDLRDQVPEYLDVLFTCANGIVPTTYNFMVPTSVDFQQLLSALGVYTFVIVITSPDTRSAKFELDLDWRGNWQSATATGRQVE